MTGTSLATLRASPAGSVESTTAVTSLYEPVLEVITAESACAASSNAASREGPTAAHADVRHVLEVFPMTRYHTTAPKVLPCPGIGGYRALPTISNVGASTLSSACSARSGRPPREITAATCSLNLAAVINAAATPVLAPKLQLAAPAVQPGSSPSVASCLIARRAEECRTEIP